MNSTSFPSTVSPVMTGRQPLRHGGPPEPGKPHHLTVIMPVMGPPAGALGQAAGPPVHPLATEVNSVAAQVQDLIGRVKSIPGIDHATYDAGAAAIVHGLGMIAASIPKPR